MNVSKEVLYNIDDAKALSMHLSGAKPKTDVERVSPYIQFSSGVTVATGKTPVSRPPQRSVSEPPPVQPSEPFSTWESMLKWCIEVTQSKSCFVVDPQGFILMREGEEFTDDGFEGAGANLKLAIEQLGRMELDSGEVQIMDFTYQKKNMLVVQVPDADVDIYTLCFIGASGITKVQKQVLFQQIQQSLLKLA